MRKLFLVFVLSLFIIPIQIKAQNQLQNDKSVSSITNNISDSGNSTTPSNLSVTADMENETPIETENTGNMNIPIILGIIVIAVIILFVSKRTKKPVSKEETPEIQNFSQAVKTITNDENPNEMELLAIATTLQLHIQNEQGGHEVEATGFYLKNNPTLSPWATKSFNFKKTPIKIK